MDLAISEISPKDVAYDNAVRAYMAYHTSQEVTWDAHKLSSEELGRRSTELRAKVEAAGARAVAAVDALVSCIVTEHTSNGISTEAATMMAMLILDADSELYAEAAERVFRAARKSSNRYAREADELARAEGRPCQPTAHDYAVACTRAAVAGAGARNATLRFTELVTPGEDRRVSARMEEAARDRGAWGYNVPGQERRRTEKALAQSILNTYRELFGNDWTDRRLELLADQPIVDPTWPRQ